MAKAKSAEKKSAAPARSGKAKASKPADASATSGSTSTETAPEAEVLDSREDANWTKAAEILAAKKKAFEAGDMDGYAYNTHVAPCIEMYEAGNRGKVLLNRINQL